MRGGRMTIALLLVCIAVNVLIGAWALVRWSMPERPAVCGKTVRLSTGVDALVICDEDDAPRSGD